MNAFLRYACILTVLPTIAGPDSREGTRRWTYLRCVNDKSSEALCNLIDDPRETRNLAQEIHHQNTLMALRRQCGRLAQTYADRCSGVPSGLMVDYIREPGGVAIADNRPEYSWIVPREAVLQKGYQVLVASGQEEIDRNIGDVWDSGQVRQSQSANVEHEGEPLQPHTTYYWKVRIWDQDNRLSAYSAVQGFETGDFDRTVSTKNSFRIERIAPVTLTKTGTGRYLVDFGKDAFGTLELDYKTDSPETLTLRIGEKLKDGKIDREPGGTVRCYEARLNVSPGQTHYTLDLPRDERNTSHLAVPLPASFGVIAPFRYVEIENASQNLGPEDLRQKAFFHYFREDQSSFSSSDPILSQVWDLCKYSMKATSFTGLYIDGDRERIPYEADAYINQLSHYCVDREYAMARQTIEWFMDHPTWPTEWLLHTAMLVHQDYYYTGNAELIQAYYENLKHKSLIALAREDGLISTQTGKVTEAYLRQLGFNPPPEKGMKDIVDWPAGKITPGGQDHEQKGERDGYQMLPINTVVNCFFYHNMTLMAEFAQLLDKPEDAATFTLMAVKVKKAINEKLLDPDKGIYIDGEGTTHSSLHCNMMPLAFDIVPRKHIPSVVAFVKSRGMACSVYGAQYLLEGLYRAGEGQYALDLMRATHDRSWYNMIKVGSTITLEAWDMKYKPNADWNHAWGAAPGNIIPRCLWGIRPKVPGFSVATIAPQTGDLEHSTIEVPTLLGPIKAQYLRRSERWRTYTIELPANMVAEFAVPGLAADKLTLNGETVDLTSGSVRVGPGTNGIDLWIHH